MTVTEIAARLLAYRFRTGREADLQADVAEVLRRAGVVFEPELSLSGGRGRIDFYIPAIRTGLELKVKGSPVQVIRQLQRYLACPEIDAVVLVTARARLGAMPRELGGKPVHVVAIWRGGL